MSARVVRHSGFPTVSAETLAAAPKRSVKAGRSVGAGVGEDQRDGAPQCSIGSAELPLVVRTVLVTQTTTVGPSQSRPASSELGWLGVIILALLPSKPPLYGHAESPPVPVGKRACPECAGLIQAAARVCKHCGYRFEGAEPVAESTTAPE